MKKTKFRILTSLLAVMLCCTAVSTTAFAFTDETAQAEAEATEPAGAEETAEPEHTEETVTDTDVIAGNVFYNETTNKQFITVTDRDGNTFYIIIDYDAPVNEEEELYQTYFLNPVDLSDLEAMAGEEETAETELPATCTCSERCQYGAVNTGCEVCAKDMTECVGKEPVTEVVEEPTTPEEPETEEPSSGLNPVILLLVLALACGGGAFAYFKLIKPRPKTRGSDDLDDYDYGDEDEEGEDEVWETEGEDVDEDAEVSEGELD